MEVNARLLPVALNRPLRHARIAAISREREAAEKFQVDDFGQLQRSVVAKLVQRVADLRQSRGPRLADRRCWCRAK